MIHMSEGPAAAAIGPLVPVATVVGGRLYPEDDDWAKVQAVIRLDADRFGAEAVAGLGEFTHLEVVYVFHRAAAADETQGARHPRGRTDWPRVGIFAQRGKDRPNHLGVSRCRLLRVDGLDLHVAGLDAIDGTPVLDIKPWLAEFGPRGVTRQPAWATELMAGYYARPEEPSGGN
jgi:tRNA-Thr(GGU) m(6)t(6)A37 methyltransferase TsaA